MIRYFGRRLLVGLPTLLVASAIVFIAVVHAAGDPRDRLATCVGCDQTAYDEQVATFALDDSLPTQYASWLGRLTSGNLQPATSQGDEPVVRVAASRFANTLWLVVPAWLIATSLVIMLAAKTVANPLGWLSKGYRIAGTWGLAVPAFLTGLVLQSAVVWVADRWGLKPFWSQGMYTDSPSAFLSSATLPSLTLILMLLARRYALTRSAIEAAWSASNIAAARARGMSERRLLWKHTLRQAIGPFLAASWGDVTLLVGGAVVVETVFAWPGVGQLLIAALRGSDIELSLFLAFGAVVIVLLTGIVVDLVHAAFDPRVRDRQTR